MNRPYLLTFKGVDGRFDFCWFESEEELREYVETYNIQVAEAYHIKDADELEI